VFLGYNAAAYENDVLGAGFVQELFHPWDESHMGARKDANSHDIDVLVDRYADNLLRSAANTGVDYLHSGFEQAARYNARSYVVTVKAHFGHEESDFLRHAHDFENITRQVW